jgi:cytochrome c-type biogenesis protein
MTEVSYIVAFTAGLLSFFSPCVLPLVPAYIANLAGITAIDTKTRTSHFPAFLHSIAFVIGFSFIFIVLGASVGLVGTLLTAYTNLLRQIAGAVIIAAGIFLIAAYKFPWLNFEKRLDVNTARNPSYIRSIIIGAVFAFGWTPCVGPILGAILTLAWSSQQVWEGTILLIIYSLGLGIPFILIGLLWGYVIPLWRSINRYLGIISIVSGLLLIIVGILIFTGNLSWLSQFA